MDKKKPMLSWMGCFGSTQPHANEKKASLSLAFGAPRSTDSQSAAFLDPIQTEPTESENQLPVPGWLEAIGVYNSEAAEKLVTEGYKT